MNPRKLKFTTGLLLVSLCLTACQLNSSESVSTLTSASIIPTATTEPAAPTQIQGKSTATALLSPTAAEAANQESSDLGNELIAGVDWFILIQDADNGEIILDRNADTPFKPASMIKVPTAMAVLHILEDQGRSLEDLKSFGIEGRNFDSLLEAMIVRSEESATDALEYFARGDNLLRKNLDAWGLTHTTYDPRTSTANDLATALRLLDSGTALNAESSRYLLDLMGVYTENDQILLGKLTDQLPDCVFLNKRGTMLSPTIVSDMGILRCGEQSWYLVVAGTPSSDSSATFEDIQASIESFAGAFASYAEQQSALP